MRAQSLSLSSITQFATLSLLAVGSIVGSMSTSVAAQSTTELTFFYPVLVPGPITELFDELVDDFTQQNPDIAITSVYSGSYDETTDRIQTLLRGGGKLPDIAIIGNQHTVMYVDLDAIIPLDPFISAEGEEYIADFVPGFM